MSKDQVEVSSRYGKTVWSLKKGALKKGINVLSLESGNNLEVEFNGDKISKVSLMGRDGKASAVKNFPGTVLEFSCNSSWCTCSGDADCNDMFSTTLCGPNAVCFEPGPICVCMR